MTDVTGITRHTTVLIPFFLGIINCFRGGIKGFFFSYHLKYLSVYWLLFSFLVFDGRCFTKESMVQDFFREDTITDLQDPRTVTYDF